jgi:two-component system, sporulation sensor kinase E
MKKAFQELFLYNPCAMILVAVNTEKVININDSFVALTGYDRMEIVGQPLDWLAEIISPTDFSNMRKLLINNQTVKGYQCKFTMQAKRTGSAKIDISYLTLDEIAAVLITIVDVTENVELKDHIERLSCLNLVGQLAASIGHEIRNPMTTVRGYIRFMQRKPDFSKYNEQFSMMIRELDRANEIITDFLALAKNRVNGFAVQNMNDIIADISPLIEAMASELGHTIEFDLQQVPDLLLDKIDIHKALINLVKNGFEAMEHKGKIIVRTYKEENFVVLQVIDEGKGIPREIVEKLGTPFFTTKEKGTGLGLSVCYQIANRHEAILDIKTSHIGSVFSLTFPYKNA